MYTNRYQYRTQVTPRKKDYSKLITIGAILSIAILANIIVELPLYQNIIVALS